MFAEERYRQISTLVSADGRVTVAGLSSRFGITKETVRRDLALLETDGVLRRVHGGAIAGTGATTNEPSLTSRSSQRSPEKKRIAQAALSLAPLAGAVIVDAGSTTGALADLLVSEARPALAVVTHSVPVAALISGAGLSVELVGGRVRALTSAAVGSSAVAHFSRLRADVAFIGTNGIAAGFGLSTPDIDEAAVKTAIVHSARRVVLLADSSKFDEETLISFANLEDIDVLITDRAPRGPLAEALADADVEVTVA
ncbi:MAG: D-beta-D-heptose 1-phosphate adenosyltransferase [Micrococcaceae bacterium]|jgi:DeoR family fructose operon transcriptional repressor|uniref:Lactose phosphotransferase system repressor n=1 Tax=Arthrobacter cheniae TaxID=1258888 RepID=A0A3A5MEM6_9MICC|nr:MULTISPECIES: DeoR/GlpR family DNA-binding transcription regulator [Arthrobacter]MCU1633211.1 D-beta-D-heptose 1-phosphate adenosyltransferase [Micrococcaceae bacterium]MEC5199361.1 DeoR family fructose operon transcriptional repressor [Arthrobacter sp. PL16]RJT80078.1 DeoR/GlpR transcriptional regulator [Arthrobacter cheniae]